MLFFLSTYGEGGPTDDAMELTNLLESKSRGKYSYFDELTNKHFSYTIFGLGSSKYENFNEMSKKFEKVFQKVGLKRVIENGIGDDANDINEDYEKWRKTFWQETVGYFNKNSENIIKASEELNLKELYEGMGEEIDFVISNDKKSDSNNIEINQYDFGTKRFLQSDYCEIEEISELRKENINGSTLKVKYSISENSKVNNYKAGDNIGIFPTNNETYVNYILSRFGYDGESYLNLVKLRKLKKKVQIPDGFTIRSLLSEVIDLSCHIK